MSIEDAAAREAGSKARPLTAQIELLYQTLETELGGVEVYTAALACVQDESLREEWKEYLAQTEAHVRTARELCTRLGLDPDRETPGRLVVRHLGRSLVKTMQVAQVYAQPEAVEIVAAECVALAESKDHANWSLISRLAEYASTLEQAPLQSAYDRVKLEEEEHLHHARGWARELWLAALELPAQVPPPEEVEDVHSEEEALEARKRSAAERT
jgi:rubrerythrin